MTYSSRTWLVSVICFSVAANSCGGDNKKGPEGPASVQSTKAVDFDGDAFALVPANPISLTNVDARGLLSNATLGPSIARVLEKYVPVGEECGFSASRDIDRVIVASYTLTPTNMVGVLRGKFDVARWHAAAAAQTPLKAGGALAESTYAGRTLYVANRVSIALLSNKTALVGDDSGVHAALDRLAGTKIGREIPPWMLETAENRDATVAVAANFGDGTTQTSVQGISLPFVQGLRAVRVLGLLKSPNFSVGGSLTYGTDAQATSAASELKRGVIFVNLASMTGNVPRLDNSDVHAETTSVQIKFDVAEAGIANLLKNLPKLMGAE